MSLNDWLKWNLTNQGGFNRKDVDWETLFSILSWLLWKTRNSFIFSRRHSSMQEAVDMGVSWARSCTSSNPAQILAASTVTSHICVHLR